MMLIVALYTETANVLLAVHYRCQCHFTIV